MICASRSSRTTLSALSGAMECGYTTETRPPCQEAAFSAGGEDTCRACFVVRCPPNRPRRSFNWATRGRRITLTDDDVRTFLEEMHRKRGYTLEMHRVMASADLEWLKRYTAFLEATYTNQRLLDRKTKELLQIVVETALRADVEQIRAHIRLALNEGATAREILEALQAVIAPMGALAFRRGIQAWAAETGVASEAHHTPDSTH